MYDRLKSAYLKKVRTEKGLKLSAVASLTHYSTAYISELERGKKTISNDNWDKLFSLLEIPTIIDDSEIETKLQELSRFHNSIYMMENEESLLYLNETKQYFDLFNNSPLFINYALVMFAYFLNNYEKEKATEKYNLLTLYSSYFSQEENYAFLIYSACYYILIDNLDSALTSLNHAQELKLDIKPLSSLMHYYYSCHSLFQNNQLMAYHHIKIAQDLFFKCHNLNRYYACLQIEANIYSEQKMYTLANNLYQELIKTTKSNLKSPLYNTSCLSFCYNLIKQNKYMQAYTILSNCFEGFYYFPQYVLNKILCLYNIDSHECLIYINNLDISKLTHEYILVFSEIIRLLINENHSNNLEEKLIYLLNKYPKEMDSTAKEFILTQLLEYYRRTDNIKKQNKTLEALVALYKGEPHESL